MIEVHVGLAGRHFCKFCGRAFGREHWGPGAGVGTPCPGRKIGYHRTEVRRQVVIELARGGACVS